jgi:hypothetical protein
MIELLRDAGKKGLNPEDYNVSRRDERIRTLQASANGSDLACFDVALTVCSMRYVSDLHIGRINPAHVKFGLSVEQKKYDLAPVSARPDPNCFEFAGSLGRSRTSFCRLSPHRGGAFALHRTGTQRTMRESFLTLRSPSALTRHTLPAADANGLLAMLQGDCTHNLVSVARSV